MPKPKTSPRTRKAKKTGHRRPEDEPIAPWTPELQAYFDAATAPTPEQVEVQAECPICHFGQGIAKGVIHMRTGDIAACVPCIWTLKTLSAAERRWAVMGGYDAMEWQPKRLPHFRQWLLETGRYVEHPLQKAS